VPDPLAGGDIDPLDQPVIANADARVAAIGRTATAIRGADTDTGYSFPPVDTSRGVDAIDSGSPVASITTNAPPAGGSLRPSESSVAPRTTDNLISTRPTGVMTKAGVEASEGVEIARTSPGVARGIPAAVATPELADPPGCSPSSLGAAEQPATIAAIASDPTSDGARNRIVVPHSRWPVCQPTPLTVTPEHTWCSPGREEEDYSCKNSRYSERAGQGMCPAKAQSPAGNARRAASS